MFSDEVYDPLLSTGHCFSSTFMRSIMTLGVSGLFGVSLSTLKKKLHIRTYSLKISFGAFIDRTASEKTGSV